MEIIFLGTSSMVPTRDRNHAGILIRYGTDGILLDCGEGIQRQLRMADIRMTAVNKILLTHWHGDHVLGLPGLLQTLSSAEPDKTVEVYGPKGTKLHMEHLFKAFVFENKINLKIHEIKEGVFFETGDYQLECLPLEHGVSTLGYVFQEKPKRRMNQKKLDSLGLKGPLVGKLQEGSVVTHKGKKVSPDDVSSVVQGKKVAYVTDTKLCENCYALAHGADVFICESTYGSKLEGKGEEYNHMTALQAAEIAARSGVQKLYLTHFSARYKNVDELEEEARTLFPDAIAAYDFLKVKL